MSLGAREFKSSLGIPLGRCRFTVGQEIGGISGKEAGLFQFVREVGVEDEVQAVLGKGLLLGLALLAGMVLLLFLIQSQEENRVALFGWLSDANELVILSLLIINPLIYIAGSRENRRVGAKVADAFRVGKTLRDAE